MCRAAEDSNLSPSEDEDVLSGESLPLSHHEDRARGLLLAAMCGNVLAAPIDTERQFRIARMFPQGLTDFWKYDISEWPLPYGHYTGDYASLLSVAKSLIDQKQADLYSMVNHLVESYDPDHRPYNPYAALTLDALFSGAELFTLSDKAEAYLDTTSSRRARSSSDRPDREPFGASDYGAAVRIAPLGLAYRHADLELKQEAVLRSVMFTHANPLGLDSALVMVEAVGWLCKTDPRDTDTCQPEALLDHLLLVANTQEMKQKIQTVKAFLTQLPEIDDWQSTWSSVEWYNMVRVNNWLTRHNYATLGPEAMAVALWCLCSNWLRPEQALVTAVHLGGSALATCTMTGALVGALHGAQWIPTRWTDNLENGDNGHDHVMDIARLLAELECDSVGVISVAEDNQDFGNLFLEEEEGQEEDEEGQEEFEEGQEEAEEVQEAARRSAS